MCEQTTRCYGPGTVKLMVTKTTHGYNYFINVSPTEWLDVARGLWILGADYIAVSHGDRGADWYFNGYANDAVKPRGKLRIGGYSND